MGGAEPWCRLTQREQDERCPILTGTEWKVYTALATCRNHQTMRTPAMGISLIERKAGVSERAAFRAAARLEELGFVSRRKVGQKTVYTFL